MNGENIANFWKRLGEVNGSKGDHFLTSDAQLVLLKFADGMVHAGDPENFHGRELSAFIPILEDLVKVSVPRLFRNLESFNNAEVECLTSSLRLLLDILRTQLAKSGETGKSLLSSSGALAKSLVGMIAPKKVCK